MRPEVVLPELCLDSKCSFGKIVPLIITVGAQLCLDSKCSFGKMGTATGDRSGGFALIPNVLSAKSNSS